MKRTAILLPILLALTAPARGAELIAGERVFLEVAAEPAVIYLQQPFRVILRVGIEREFAETNLVSLFNRRMDLQLHVRAPWLLELPETERLPEVGREAKRLSLAINDDVVEAVRAADREVDGRAFTVVEIERRYRAVAPGEVRLSAPTLRFAWATEFVRDFISGKRPKDRRDLLVTGEPFVLTIRPLPEEGRPASFTGAVGRFRMRAAVEVREAAVEDVVKLTLVIEGEGNLATFDTPDLGEIEGFHVLGAIDDHAAGRRTVVYDLVVLDGAVDGIPAIALPFFDPGPPAGYRVARTAPIPLELAPIAETPPPDAMPAPQDDGPTAFQILAMLWALVMITIGIAAVLRRRIRARRRVDPEDLRARQAAEVYRGQMASPNPDLAAAFTGYLASRLRCAPAQVISSELAARLMAAGISEDPATRTSALVESLVAMNYGGTLSAEDAAASATRMVEELEPQFTE